MSRRCQAASLEPLIDSVWERFSGTGERGNVKLAGPTEVCGRTSQTNIPVVIRIIGAERLSRIF